MKMLKTEYHEETISEVIKRISSNDIFLPALQRKFVWKSSQIENLFDSIMQGYPIGTFLFWEINSRDKINNYVFYKFIDHYHERETRNQQEILTSRRKLVSVLDGQQRLTSMNIALRGSYSFKIPRKHINNPEAYPTRYLYLNLIPSQGEDFVYEFKFLTQSDLKKYDGTKVWYKVNKILLWDNLKSLDSDYKNLKETNDTKIITQNRFSIKATLKLLYHRLKKDTYITHFDLKNMEIDDVLDIFIRVNSGGTKLSKTDLLMSTITASWEKARDEVEDLLDQINRKGRKFEFDIDFIMRASLVLMDLPVLFKVRTFAPKTINLIKERWDNLSSAIHLTVDLLDSFGFDGLTLTSRNAVIPIIYYIYKGGRTKDNDRAEIKKYLQRSLLTGFFGSHGDQALSNIRNLLRIEKDNGVYELKKKNFSFYDLKQNLQLTGKTLEIKEEDIDDFLELKKGRKSFLILSLLYPSLRYNEINFDQDHIHPAMMFKSSNLKTLGLDNNQIEKWNDLKDKIPNLQIMEARRNRVKNKTQFSEWLVKEKISDKKIYLQQNHIPENVSFSFNNFEQFFYERKKILKSVLIKILIDEN